MTEWWPAIAFGWPPVIVATGLSVAGIFRKRPGFLLAAAIISLPFALYLAATPAFRWTGLLLPVFLVLSAAAVRSGRLALAWLLLVPFVGTSLWIAFLVLSE